MNETPIRNNADDLETNILDECDLEKNTLSTKKKELQKNSSNNLRKRRKEEEFKKQKKNKVEKEINNKKEIFIKCTSAEICCFLNKKIRKIYSNLSEIELKEKFFTEAEIRSSQDFENERTLSNLKDFLKKKFNNMITHGKQKKNNQNINKNSDIVEKQERKFILIMSMSAIRVCDVYRATRELQGSSIKLISKNKIEKDYEVLKKTESRILCCTPNKILKLVDEKLEIIKRSELKVIVVDATFTDSKCRDIWELEQTYQTLKSLTSSGSKIYFY